MTAPLPPEDATTRPWWQATRERRLLLQSCARCAYVQHPPRAICLTCGATALGWREARGTGSVDSFTIVHRAPTPAFSPPYVVARVRLDEGPLLLTNLVDIDETPLACGAPVALAWRTLPDGRHLPVFVPRES